MTERAGSPALSLGEEGLRLPSSLEDGRSAVTATTTTTPTSVLRTATATAARPGEGAPLNLLDLPVDVLKEIIQQLPHTNDLTSLCLCHSALHRLTIPYIYSRFDIVWPDESPHAEPRSGVDALTYGLATLAMGDDCFPHQHRRRWEEGASSSRRGCDAPTLYPLPRRRFGNYYGQFTKKFSLGNGPQAWVREYMITKEGGKMLGTLVALALARMINLETFVWDMPTGVLRDVWLALSSLAHRTDGEQCRLERLWCRFHNNSINAPAPLPAPPMMLSNQNHLPPPPNPLLPSSLGHVQPPVMVAPPYAPSSLTALDRVEHPTFSAIPALKSLSVLDIDELPYLDEMSILIARSHHKLRELRVGIAPHAQQRDWVTVWEGDGLQQVEHSIHPTASSSVGEKRLGGVLGVLVGRIHNMRHSDDSQSPKSWTSSVERHPENTAVKTALSNILPSIASLTLHERDGGTDVDHFGNPMDESSVAQAINLVGEQDANDSERTGPPAKAEGTTVKPKVSLPSHSRPVGSQDTSRDPAEPQLVGKLKLEVLELERIPLSVSVLRRAFDWSILSTLTLLHCSNHEQLWKVLRRTYTPRSAYPASPTSKAFKASYTLRSDYQLSLKRIHTNTVSPSLISFLKETLAPNSLEVLFLQEGRSYSSTVTVDAIYKGPLRRHRASLKKLMIDSGEKGPDGPPPTSSRWRRWMLNREILTFITSGRMSHLRELAVSIDYKDWHHFLQRLPLIPHIRSLYIPYIADHAHGSNIDPRELAYQILDIVHLRPEIELCYMGLSSKCFEILENRPANYDVRHDGIHGDGGGGGGGGGSSYMAHEPMLSDDESEVTEDEDDEDDLDDGMVAAAAGEETESEASDEAEAESDDEDSLVQDSHKGPKLRVREILFYEERVEAFRRRHGLLRP